MSILEVMMWRSLEYFSVIFILFVGVLKNIRFFLLHPSKNVGLFISEVDVNYN